MEPIKDKTINLHREVGGRTWTVEGLPAYKAGRGESPSMADGIKADQQIARMVLKAGQGDGTLRTGAVFKHLRRLLGFKAKDFAVVCGVAPQTMSRWENDRVAVPGSVWALMSMLAASEDPVVALERLMDAPVGDVPMSQAFEG